MDEPDLSIATLPIALELRPDVVVPRRWRPDLDYQRQRPGESIECPRIVFEGQFVRSGNHDDVRNVVAARGEAGATAVDVHPIQSPIELGDERCPKIGSHVVVLHAHQRLLPRHAVPQLPEPVRLVESELPVLLLADAIDDGHDECLRGENQPGYGQWYRTEVGSRPDLTSRREWSGLDQRITRG